MQESNAVLNTIQSMTNQIFVSIDNSLISVLDKLLYVDNDLLRENSYSFFLDRISMTTRVIAESILIGYVLYYLIRYLISRITATNRDDIENPVAFFIKVIFIGIGIFYAQTLCRMLVEINSNISTDFAKNMDPSDLLPTISRLLKTINHNLLGGETQINIFSIDGIFKGFVSFGTLNMTVTFALRYILLRVIIISAPLAIVSKVFSKTGKVFDMWLKTFVSLLLIQHFITILLLLGVFFKYSFANTFNKIAYIGIIYAMSKSFSIFEKIFGGIAPDAQVSFPFK